MSHIHLFKSLIVGLLLLLTTALTGAQDSPWSVYLYDSSTAELIRVWQDGREERQPLSATGNLFISSYDLAISPDGSRVAYCMVNWTADPATTTATLTLRDLNTQQDVLLMDMGTVNGCRTGRPAFNPAGTQFAVSTVSQMPDGSGNTNMPAWRIQIIDPTNPQIAAELNAESPAAALITNEGPMLPYVVSFTDDTVIFAAVPYGIGGGAIWPAYRWSLITGEVEPVERWGNLTLDTLGSTGEQVWAAEDPSQPAANPGGPIPANNVVILADATGERLLYHTADWVIVAVKFVNGGRQIAVQQVSTFDDLNPASQVARWILIDRAGQITTLPEQSAALSNNAITAPNGLAVLDFTMSEDGSQSIWTLNGYQGDVPTILWTSTVTGMAPQTELVWSAPFAPAENLLPFAQ